MNISSGNDDFGALFKHSFCIKDVYELLHSCKDFVNNLLSGIDKNDCLARLNWNMLDKKLLHSKKVLYECNNHSAHPFELNIELQEL